MVHPCEVKGRIPSTCLVMKKLLLPCTPFPALKQMGWGKPKNVSLREEASPSSGLLVRSLFRALKNPIKPAFGVLLTPTPTPIPWGLGWLQVKVALETQFWHPFLQEAFPSAPTPHLHPLGVPPLRSSLQLLLSSVNNCFHFHLPTGL